MTYTDSEITRLFAELITRPDDRYKIRQEIRWLVQNSLELSEKTRAYYEKRFDIEGTDPYDGTLQ